jgi:hypothetical protein
MTGTITYILSRAGYRAMNGPLADERRRLAGAEPPAAYVSYDPRLLAGAGWYGYRIALNGGDRSMVERARYMLSERYVIRDGYEYYADGVYVFGVLLRERVKLYGIGGGAEPGPSPIDDWWGLKLTMPEGGTVILRKYGSPNAVSLETSIDGENWQPWTLVGTDYRYTLEEGQTLCIRNTSSTFVPFSKDLDNCYQFAFDDPVEAYGSVMSLSCNDSQHLSLSGANYNFCSMFRDCTSLVNAPDLPATTLASYCYYYMFYGCTSLVNAPDLPATTLASGCYYYMFRGCTTLSEIRIHANDISASNCLTNWLSGVAVAGDFYCDPSLTIPTGASGIPNGWTRHDI